MIHVCNGHIGWSVACGRNKDLRQIVLNNRCEVRAGAVILHDHPFARGRVHDEEVIHSIAGEIRRTHDPAGRGEICKIARDDAATRTCRCTIAAIAGVKFVAGAVTAHF